MSRCLWLLPAREVSGRVVDADLRRWSVLGLARADAAGVGVAHGVVAVDVAGGYDERCHGGVHGVELMLVDLSAVGGQNDVVVVHVAPILSRCRGPGTVAARVSGERAWIDQNKQLTRGASPWNPEGAPSSLHYRRAFLAIRAGFSDGVSASRCRSAVLPDPVVSSCGRCPARCRRCRHRTCTAEPRRCTRVAGRRSPGDRARPSVAWG